MDIKLIGEIFLIAVLFGVCIALPFVLLFSALTKDDKYYQYEKERKQIKRGNNGK
jgi:hypothetical protein